MSKTQKRAGGNIIKFAAVLIVLTIVARGTSGATLARVTITSPSRGEIVQAVNGSAVVSSTDTVDVFAPEGLTVLEMMAKVGQMVKENDALAKFDVSEINTKLIRETAALDKKLLDIEMLEHTDAVDSSNLQNNQRYLARANEDYNSTKKQGEADVAAAQAALNEALAALNDALNTRAKEAAQAEAARAEATNRSSQNTTDASVSDPIAGDHDFYTTSETVANTTPETDPDTSDNPGPDVVAEKQAAVDMARSALESAQRRAREDLLNATRRIEDAQSGLSSAQLDHDRNLNRHSETVEGNKIDATVLQLEIEKQKAIVNKLKALLDNNGTFYSDREGVVSVVNSVGNTTGTEALLTLKGGEKGFEATMFLDKDDVDDLSISSECEVTTGGGTMYFMPTVTGTISAMAPPDEDDKVKITIRLPQGEWTEGQRVDVHALQDRSIHEMCIPLSALRSDNTGYFVLLAEQRSTVLGVENIVERVPVIVMATDRDSASIQGPVDRSSQVINGSSKPVTAGDRVRVN